MAMDRDGGLPVETGPGAGAPIGGIKPLPAAWPLGRPDAKQRIVPHNYEAEQGLLGALMVNNRAYDRVADILLPEHFADPAHGRIFKAIATLVERGSIANPVTLKAQFDRDEQLREVGGAQYLVKLAGSIVSIVNAEDYARTIFGDWCRRELQAIGEDLVSDAGDYKLDREIPQIVSEIEGRLWGMVQDRSSAETLPEPVGAGVDIYLDQADAALKAGGKLVGLTMGIITLDDVTGGLHGSDLIVLAARPGMGKTALALNLSRGAACALLAEAAADPDAPPPGQILFFSLEMNNGQLAGRLLAERTGIATDRVRKGQIDEDELRRLVAAGGWVRSLPLIIDRSSGITVAQMRSRARRIKRQFGLRLIVVDYIQLIRGEGSNRVEVVTNITRELKEMAKEFDVPVVALSQLSRALEARDDKRPVLSDLRESGSIEQDADSVYFIYRDEYYLLKQEPRPRQRQTKEALESARADWEALCRSVSGIAEVNLAKNRHGPVCTVKLKFNGPAQRFSDLDPNAARQGSIPGFPEEIG